MKLKRKSIISLVLLVVFLLGTVTTFAAEARLTQKMYYDAKAIAVIDTDSFKPSGSAFILQHSTLRWMDNPTKPSDQCVLTIELWKKGSILFSDTGDTKTRKGKVDAEWITYTKSPGTYRFRFRAGSYNGIQAHADIRGSVFE